MLEYEECSEAIFSMKGNWKYKYGKQSDYLFFCFEQFEVSLEIGSSFTGNNIEIYDCEICCNPNKLEYVVYDCEINISNVGDGNEWIILHHYWWKNYN